MWLLLFPPEIVRLCCVGFEWQGDFAAGAGRVVGGEDDLEHGPSVTTGDQRLLVVEHAVDEVAEIGAVAEL